MAHAPNSLKSIIFALGANCAIAVAKFVAAVFTGSGSMLAEAIHSLADCANQGLLLWGLRAARRPASADFPLGHGKAIYFWSFMVALLLFSVGGLFSIVEGLHKLQHPQALQRPWLALLILLFGVVMESLSLWAGLRETSRGQHSLWRWFRDTRQGELLVVVGEDIAALLGLALALCFIALALLSGNPAWDACGSIAVGILLVAVAVLVGRKTQALLIGQSADHAEERAIRSWLQQRPEVLRVLNIITLQLGGDIMLAVKAELAGELSLAQAITAINATERELKQQFPAVRWIFFEPDVTDD